MPEATPRITAAEVVLPCAELDPMIEFMGARLGFRVDAIYPADDPRTAALSGHGLRVLLRRGDPGAPGRLRLRCADPGALAGGARELVAPNGTVLELVADDPPRAIPPLRPALVITRDDDGAAWIVGRAGMRYRDLIPGRLGGRFIASHIRIPEGGPVPDYVHFHEVRFQMIYCRRGWVRVVYEDQGAPLIMREGDCVLQPPQIRHRVLDCSPGLEVIEIGCPAEHVTRVEHELALPTATARPARAFAGQRFVHHVAAAAAWQPWRAPGFEARDAGIAEATGGLASVRVARARAGTDAPPAVPLAHGGELLLLFVLEGAARLELDAPGDGEHALPAGACLALPAGAPARLRVVREPLELLEVTLPA